MATASNTPTSVIAQINPVRFALVLEPGSGPFEVRATSQKASDSNAIQISEINNTAGCMSFS